MQRWAPRSWWRQRPGVNDDISNLANLAPPLLITFDTPGTGIAKSGVHNHGFAVLDKRCNAEVGLYKWLGWLCRW